MTSEVIGIIFTTGSISKRAVKEIESDRTREVLVFLCGEIELLRAHKARLSNLIVKKRSELRLKGRVWFRTGVGGEYLGVVLPKPTIEYMYESKGSGYFCSKTEFAHAVSSLDIPDTGWSSPGGEGVRLNLPLSLSTLEELRDLFGYLHDSFGLSSSGAFTIHQDGACWHGSGVGNFMRAAGEVWRRYRAAAMERVHHSESWNDEVVPPEAAEKVIGSGCVPGRRRRSEVRSVWSRGQFG